MTGTRSATCLALNGALLMLAGLFAGAPQFLPFLIPG